jgi:alpha-tubulin suppressor-like RCC1 family protein
MRATAVAAGGAHSCALTSGGGVKCWGSNIFGGLGRSTTDRWTPVDVSGLSRGATAVAAGNAHSCALTSGGGVKCWGLNHRGQVGDGTTSNRYAPVDVVGLSSGITAIAAGDAHSCALMGSGGVRCWGDNNDGQLGDGTTIDRLIPVEVVGLSGRVTAIATGAGHSCALISNGGVECWGLNENGQLGDGSTSNRARPVDVVGLSGAVTAIAGGDSHSCAVTKSGGVECWGWNAYRQLGDGTTSDRLTPVGVRGLARPVTAIAAGAVHSCALMSAGGAECWGVNSVGQLGDGTTGIRLAPVGVSGLGSGVTAVAAGSGHSCALTSAGGVECWGSNLRGELGDGTVSDRARPVDVIGFGAATLAIVSRTVTVTPTRVAPVRLRCGFPAGCRGTISLTASVNGKLLGTSGRRVQLVLGSRTFSTAVSNTRLNVALTARGFALLVRVKRLPTRARISTQLAGGTIVAARAIALIAPKSVSR